MSGMFNILDERFYLVDVDKVVAADPVRIYEPENFGDIGLSIDGKKESRGGLNFEFGDEESELGFDRVKYKGTDEVQTLSGFDLIDQIMDLVGSDANIELHYYQNDLRRYRGNLILTTINEDDVSKFFRVRKMNYGSKIETRMDVEVDIESDEDLDGNKINPFETISLPMHSRKIFAEGIHNVLEPEEFDGIPSLSITQNNSGPLWGVSVFNDEEKTYENMPVLYDSAFFEEGFTNNDQERFVDLNQMVQQGLYLYKAVGNSDTIQISMKHNFDIVLNTTGYDTGGTAGDGDEIRSWRVSIWTVNRQGATITFKEVVVDLVPTTSLNISLHTPNVDVSFSGELTLDSGDELYYGYHYSLGGSVGWPTFSFDVLTTQGNSGYFIIQSTSSQIASDCRAMPIYDAINVLIQKLVGTNGVGEMKAYAGVISGLLVEKEIVNGQASKAKGFIYRKSGSVLILVSCTGSFETGEAIIGETSGGIANIIHVSVGEWNNTFGEDAPNYILDSSVLENLDKNGVSADGCGGLNYVTNVFAVRDFIEKEYESEKYYKTGDKVRFEDVVYRYIFDSIEKGNLPTDVLYWEATTGRSIKSSLGKLLQFVMNRYGLGMAVYNKKGSGFGVDTNSRITKVKLEKMSSFFQDKKIMTLYGIVSITKEINTEVIHSKIKSGYGLYAKPNESESINAFLTQRNDLTPIEKHDSTLDMTVDVLADGYELERLRRLKFNNTSGVSDEKDADTCIIKCVRFNEDNPVKAEDNDTPDGPGFGYIPGNVNVKTDGEKIILEGFYFGEQMATVGEITISGARSSDGFPVTFTATVDSYSYDEVNNATTIVENGGTYPVAYYAYYDFYFDVDVITPQRREGFSDVKESVDQYSEYNVDHVISNFLVNNFAWYGSGFGKKPDTSKLQFTSGVSNVFFQKKYVDDSCEPTDEVIVENQDFTLAQMRGWDPELFGIWKYTIDCEMSYEDFVRFQAALTDESDEDINYGWVDFPYADLLDLVQGYAMKVTYNPKNCGVLVEVWERYQ